MPTKESFLSKYGHQSFNHASVIVQGLQNGSVTLGSATEGSRQLGSHYSDIYRFRLALIRETSVSEHGLSIAAEIEDLCARLERQPDSPCDIWLFFEPPHFIYSVFTSGSDGTVFGCFRSVDARLLSKDEIARLWGRH